MSRCRWHIFRLYLQWREREIEINHKRMQTEFVFVAGQIQTMRQRAQPIRFTCLKLVIDIYATHSEMYSLSLWQHVNTSIASDVIAFTVALVHRVSMPLAWKLLWTVTDTINCHGQRDMSPRLSKPAFCWKCFCRFCSFCTKHLCQISSRHHSSVEVSGLWGDKETDSIGRLNNGDEAKGRQG